MRSNPDRCPGPAARGVTLASILLALFLSLPTWTTGSEPPREAPASPPPSSSDGQTCGNGAGASDDNGASATIEATRPGPWRQDAKRTTPPIRVPGTRSVGPKDPLSTAATTRGRWVPGYRPATAEAQAAFEAWKAAQAATLGTANGAQVSNGASSAYAANLLGGVRVDAGPDEPITSTAHAEKYPISSIDLRRIQPVEEAAAPRAAEQEAEEAEREGGFDYLSGLTWEESLWVKRMAESTPPTAEAQAASSNSMLAPRFVGVGFDAIPSNITATPPDPIMAVGPTHLVAIVNRRYRVWDKTGAPLIADISIDQFFAGVPHCSGVFDVYVDYDEASDRFVMGGEVVEQTSGVDSYLCLAATETNDPTGVWHRTSFRADSVEIGTWIDYPHMGIGLDAIYITGNMFSDTGGYDHIRVFAVGKDELYQGAPVPVTEAGLTALFFTAQPVKLHGYYSGGWPAAGTPHHFIAHNGAGNSRIWRWSDPFNSPPVVYGTVVEASFNGVPPSANELGATSGGLNDTGSGRWLDAEYRHGKLWATRNVGCNLGSGAAESCIDWVEIDVSGTAPVLEQQQTGGAYGSADDFRYYPDLSVDRNDSIAIGYTKSSATSYTQVWVTGREVGDPPGTLQAEVLQRAGLGNYYDGVGCQGSCDRWGDYTGLTVDPDGCTFWYLGQYSDGGYFNWGTHIGSFRFDSCSTDSQIQVDKGTYTCSDSMTITVTDSIAIDAATVASRTTVSTSGGDAESVPAGSWTGTDCSGGDCGTWAATLPVTGDPGSSGDGAVNVGDAETITVLYADPHAAHADRSRTVTAKCSTRLEDGGYLTAGGCEAGQGAETYRDYMDGGEFIAYTFGIYNPTTAQALTDVSAELVISGPAADKVVVFNPTVYLGSLDRGTLTAPVFTLYIDPSIDAPGLRMTENDFNLRITSAADGFTEPQTLTQTHLLQADDNIVTQDECFNFESGTEGFVEAAINYSYTCNFPACPSQTGVFTGPAPWSRGAGCGSETRADDASIPCDTAGTAAFKTSADPATCGVFTQTTNTIVDSVLFSPIFAPAYTGLAANGQPWNYAWKRASWYFRSDMVSFIDPAMGVGFMWDNDYPGVPTPGPNETWDYYPYFHGYFVYPNQDWDSATPWNPLAPPANFDSVAFAGAGGPAAPGLQWRWAVEVYDADFGGNPLATPATQGLAIDDLDLTYEQYHAEEQVGSCLDPSPLVSLDRYNYLQCPSDQLGITVLDGLAAGAVQVTVTSQATGDSETFWISGAAPYFSATLPYSTAGGPKANDGTLLVVPTDQVRVKYNGASGPTSEALASVDCVGGDVVVDGLAGLSDNGDGDAYADTNETVNISIRLRNDTGQSLDNVVAILDTDDPAIDCIAKNVASFGTIATGDAGANDLATDPFTFKVSGSVACSDPLTPPTATFKVLILADGFSGPAQPQELTLVLDLDDLPGTVTFLQDFSAGPAGFVHELGPGDDDGAALSPDGLACSPYEDRFFWRGNGGNPGGGYFCWQNPADGFPGGNYGDLSDSALYSPVFKIGASGTTLSFDHEYLFGWSGQYRVDGARVDYRVNGGAWHKLTQLPYDGPLIWNTYCNPLCNGTEFGLPCFSESEGAGENIFNQLDAGAVNWTTVTGNLVGLTPGDLLQFRWRVGSMRSSVYGISTQGGYGLDNVSLTNVVQQTCDAAPNPDVGCGMVFDGFDGLTEICGDGDAWIEPTERWSVDVTLRNSTATAATNVTADLVPSGGSRNPATVIGNPGSFGSLAAAGGTGTATYEFVVGAEAVCIENVLFDLENVAADGSVWGTRPSVFQVDVGGVGTQETASQTVDPLVAADGSGASALAPAIGVPTPAFRVTLDYDSSYSNAAPVQSESQLVDPLIAENGSVTTLLGQPFAISSDSAVSAIVDWTSLDHDDLTACVRVFLQTPTGATWTLKRIGEVAANPYDILSVYRNTNGGTGQYRIGMEEVASGPCRRQATLSGATMTVTDAAPTGSWTADTQVTLWDGATSWLVKPYGAVDAAPYDVTSVYNAAGPGSYELRLEEGGGGGSAEIRSATLTAIAIECNGACGSFVPPAPPVADGSHGVGVLANRGPGPDDVEITIDNATCSADRAIVVWGNIGDFGGYQGAVSGCDLGSGPTATVTQPGDAVWFNVIWVNADQVAGHPGFASAGARDWSAAGLCGVVADDPSDGVCN